VTALSGPLVCGVDFSEPSRRALAAASAFAAHLGQPLVAVTAIDSLLSQAGGFTSGAGPFLDHCERDLRDFVGGALGHEQTPVPITYRAIVGDPAPVLLGVAKELNASMIVAGRHGLGRAHRLIFGSTTLRLMRAGTTPVLAVPVPAEGADRPFARITKIVCGLDFGDASLAAARASHALGQTLSAPVVLVHAITPVTLPTAWDAMLRPPEEQLVEDARERMKAIADRLGTPAPAQVIRLGRAEDVIGAETAEPGALIVLGLGDATGHRPGTTAMRVVAATHAPVLTVPAATTPAADA
jgi:nucleotide-binding universal stress UspA family protein